MTAAAAPPPLPNGLFAYEAQTPQGRPIRGTIQAGSLTDAQHDLLEMRLVVLSISPATARTPKPLTGEDFGAFNEQLAQLTGAGLPVEQGLRLIGSEVSSPRLAATIQLVLADLNAGRTLPEALDRHAVQFPPLYGRLVDAGIRMNNLPAMLFNMGRHLELVKRMRGAIWRTVAYPLMVGIGLLIVMLVLSYGVLPQFAAIFQDFRTTLPALTEFVLWAGHVFPPIGLVLLLILIGWPLIWQLLRLMHKDQWVTDNILLHIPVIGKILRRNMIARWCDVLRLGVEGGLDLPAALAIASDSIGSAALAADTDRMIEMLNTGTPLDRFWGGRILLPSVGTIFQLASTQNELPQALARMSAMYQEQADHQVTLIPAFLTPALILIMALSLGTVITALFLPFIRLIQAVSGS